MLCFIIKMVDKTNVVIAFFVAAVLAGLFVQYSSKIPMPARESFMQQQIGMPLNAGGIGPYDEVSIAGMSGWMQSEPLPVATAPANQSSDANKLMFMVGNRTSSDCCPAAYNTDTGCVCLSDNDRAIMAARGGNRAM